MIVKPRKDNQRPTRKFGVIVLRLIPTEEITLFSRKTFKIYAGDKISPASFIIDFILTKMLRELIHQIFQIKGGAGEF